MPACEPVAQPFERVQVRFAANGGSRVEWSYVRRFQDLAPHTTQLQGSPTSAPTADDWVDIGLPADNTFFAIDDSRRLCGKSMDWFYRVKLTTPDGVYYSPVTGGLSELSFRDWRLAQDVIRKERLRHTQYTSVKGLLFKRRRFGPPCPRCYEPLAGEANDGECPQCLGTSVLGGYYAPVPDFYVEKSLEASREQHDPAKVEGTIKRVVIRGRVMGEPEVADFDCFVEDKSSRAYYISTSAEKAVIRGYPVVQEVELRQAPYSDVIYLALPEV